MLVADALDLLVLGSGVAGLSAAVRAAEIHGMRVGVLTKAELQQATTRWAQGGVAAVLGGDPDSTDLHLADTLAAGAGLCDVDAVRVLVDEGPSRVNELIALGAMFDRDPDGDLELAREGGHSLPRIVHAGGAATGAEIERTLVDAVRAEVSVVLESSFALDLIVEAGRCRGVVAADPGGRRTEVRAANVLVATGGYGQLFAVTTNPKEATGDGVAMAIRAGVAVADIEFEQFHPTALHHPVMPRPLLTEALRGHGALLRDRDGERFVDELLPRDKVSRAVTARMLEQGVEHLWLDATALERFAERFPTIAAELSSVGLDPAKDWLPIAPAAHYSCGGILADLNGASSLARPVGGRRGELQRRDGRQPAGLELVARRHGVRSACRGSDRQGRRRARVHGRDAGAPRRRRDRWPTDRGATGRRDHRPRPRRAAADHDHVRRRAPLGGVPPRGGRRLRRVGRR